MLLHFSHRSIAVAGGKTNQGEITVEDRRARYRMATEAGNVRVAQGIAIDLPAAERITAQEFLHVERNPAQALAKGDFRWKQQGGRDLALYALERAARTDAAGVRAAWEKQRGRLTEPERLYGNARIAYHASRQLNPRALEWYREAEGAALSEAQRAWRIRAALRAGETARARIRFVNQLESGTSSIAMTRGLLARGSERTNS